MEWGVQIAKHAGVRCLVIESNFQEVVNFTDIRQGSRSEIFWVIFEIQNLVKGFDHVNILCAHRSYNAILHSLAKLVIERCETVVWMGL